MPKYVKGHPGGPGRPRGSRNVVNQILDQLASGEGEAMVRKMIETALEGDRVAARLVLNRIWSAPKGRPVDIELPEIRTPADLVAAHAAVVAALTAQTITAEEAASVTSVLETHRRAFELVEHDKRVAELEVELRRLKAKLS